LGTLTWLGHAAFMLGSDRGKRIYVDPFLSGNPKTPDDEKEPDRVDAICVTHGHDDHVGDAVELSQRFPEAAVVAQRREALRLVIHADQDERRLQRDGGEGAAGEAGRTLVRIRGGHHRDARTEVTENLTKVVGGNHRPYLAGSPLESKIHGRKTVARAGPGRPALAGGGHRTDLLWLDSEERRPLGKPASRVPHQGCAVSPYFRDRATFGWVSLSPEWEFAFPIAWSRPCCIVRVYAHRAASPRRAPRHP